MQIMAGGDKLGVSRVFVVVRRRADVAWRGEERRRKRKRYILMIYVLKKEEKVNSCPFLEIFLKIRVRGNNSIVRFAFHSTHPPFVLKDI